MQIPLRESALSAGFEWHVTRSFRRPLDVYCGNDPGNAVQVYRFLALLTVRGVEK